jgi:hypothetical protein
MRGIRSLQRSVEADVLLYLVGKETSNSIEDYINELGAILVISVLKQTVPALKETGAALRNVMAKSWELSRTLGAEKAGIQVFQSEMDAGRPVDEVFFRARDLVMDIAAHPSSTGSRKTHCTGITRKRRCIARLRSHSCPNSGNTCRHRRATAYSSPRSG